MSLKTLLFATMFVIVVVGGIVSPLWPLCGYVLHYSIGPERQWWAAPLNQLDIRYAAVLVGVAAVSIVLHSDTLRYGRRLFSGPEGLMLLFLGIVWLLTLTMPATVGRYSTTDHPSLKLTKVLIVTLMVTHVVTSRRKLDFLLWTVIIGALILGLQAYGTPRAAFLHGRLNSVGGSDFADSNRLAGYLAAILPIVAVMFVRSRMWGRVLCFLTAGFAVNTIIMCRTRGALLALVGAALVSILMMPRKYRYKVLVGVIIGAAGTLYLSDPQYLQRAATITRSEEERDSSAQARVDLVRASLKLLADHPLGVGPGNFYQAIGNYDRRYAGRDAHNTFVRCWSELGIPGITAFLCLLGATGLAIRRILRAALTLPAEERDYFVWTAVGFSAGLAAAFTYGLTGTILYTEYTWWLLALPICLERALVNTEEDLIDQEVEEDFMDEEDEEELVEQEVGLRSS